MKDIPVFTTENGVGSLILRDIPGKQNGYIKIHDSLEPEAFLREAVSFCRAVGADRVYASGHEFLSRYPLHTAIWLMNGDKAQLPEPTASLFPVTEKTREQFRTICNEKMAPIPNASYMTTDDSIRMMEEGEGYFVHRDGVLYGIGMISPEMLRCVISLVPGKGGEIVSALASAMVSDRITLEVASENARAVRLYERLGFCKVRELSRWYKIFPDVK